MIEFKLFYAMWRHGKHFGFLEFDTPRFTFTVYSLHIEEGRVNSKFFEMHSYPGI